MQQRQHHPSSVAAFDPFSDQPGPSRPPRGPPPHPRSSSSDFGAFTSAPFLHSLDPHVANSQHSSTHTLQEDDLLGSFDDDQASSTSPRRSNPPAASEDRDVAYDLLTGTSYKTRPGQRNGDSQTKPSSSQRPAPLQISLPPRPVDISPDYVPPPRRTPRRMSTTFSAFSPGSPPLVSDAGSEIVFHPSHQPYADNAMSEMRKVQSGTGRVLSNPPATNDDQLPSQHTFPHRSPQHSKLLDTLATTTKMATKFRSALTQTNFVPPITNDPSPVPDVHPALSAPLPTGITHKTPFASAEQLAGSYTAPSGAPGFIARGSATQSPTHNQNDDDWGNIKLLGRRPGTSPVLTLEMANRLRGELPPRQRLAGSWTLLFSLDQHGASLNTLYRLVETYSATHRTAGNILVVQDGVGNRFGVFMNESIMKREGTYYGSGESFLYKLSPASDIKAFRWTGKNQYFALCETDFISFGGGGGAYGLLLDNTFSKNSSATSPAYDNEILCTAQPRRSTTAVPFDCVGLEVWGTS